MPNGFSLRLGMQEITMKYERNETEDKIGKKDDYFKTIAAHWTFTWAVQQNTQAVSGRPAVNLLDS